MALQADNRPERAKKIYLSISHGKIVKDTRGTKEYYSSVDGTLEAIYTKQSNFGGEVVIRWFIDLRDGEELYSLCLPYNSGVFKSIILALSSDSFLTRSTPIRIEPYEGRNGYTKVVVWSEGIKLDWIVKQLPEVETIQVGGRFIKDDSKRMEYILNLVNTINERVQK